MISGLFRFTLAALAAALPCSAFASQAADNLICELFRPAGTGVLAECSGPFTEDGDEIVIALAGRAPNHVSAIRLTRDGEPKPFQSITVALRPVIDPETVGILLMDMNFDGRKDLAVMKRLTGEGAGYRYFLYDPAAQSFALNAELEQIAWPEFDPETKSIQSYFEHADGRQGHDTWVWRDGKLRNTARRERVTAADGACRVRHYRLKQGVLVPTATTPCP